MNSYTHQNAAHRYIDLDIDNALDELHDCDRDELHDRIAPHLDALRALAKLAHDDLCPELYAPLPRTIADDDELSTFAFELDHHKCLTATIDAIATLIYPTPNDMPHNII